MVGRQLGVVETGTDVFEESETSGLWPCEFVSSEGDGVVLRGDWLKDSVTLDKDEDGKLRAIVAIPLGDRTFELVRRGKTVEKGKLTVQKLDRSINRFSSTVFGGEALKNIASNSGATSGALELENGVVEFSYSDISYAKRVRVHGNFTDEDIELKKDGSQFVGKAELPPGNYSFRFRVDIGESLNAEAGPQSRLGWHAGTTTGKYLSTNIVEFSVVGSSNSKKTASKPKQQVKQTEIFSNVSNEAVQQKAEAKAADALPVAPSTSVSKAAKAIETVEQEGSVKPANGPRIASDEIVASAEEIEEQKGGLPKVIIAAAGTALVVVAFFLLRNGSSSSESADDKGGSPLSESSGDSVMASGDDGESSTKNGLEESDFRTSQGY